MIDLVFFIALICLTAYLYHTSSVQPNNAAPTLLQIWTGSCNLSCRQHGYSQSSEMSGLNQTPSTTSHETPGETKKEVEIAVTTMASNCICHPCPCGHIESVIRTCKPATDMYVRNMELLGFYLYFCFQLISDTCETLSQAMEGSSNERHAEFVIDKDFFDRPLESNENITFDREKTEIKRKTLLPKMTGLLNLKRKESSVKAKSELALEKSPSAPEATVANTSQLQNPSASPSQVQACSAQVLTDGSPECSCPRCRQEGKVCISKCPKASKKE